MGREPLMAGKKEPSSYWQPFFGPREGAAEPQKPHKAGGVPRRASKGDCSGLRDFQKLLKQGLPLGLLAFQSLPSPARRLRRLLRLLWHLQESAEIRTRPKKAPEALLARDGPGGIGPY